MITELTTEEKIAIVKELEANPLKLGVDEINALEEKNAEEFQQRFLQMSALRELKNFLGSCEPENWKWEYEYILKQITTCFDISAKYQQEVEHKFEREHLRLTLAKTMQ